MVRFAGGSLLTSSGYSRSNSPRELSRFLPGRQYEFDSSGSVGLLVFHTGNFELDPSPGFATLTTLSPRERARPQDWITAFSHGAVQEPRTNRKSNSDPKVGLQPSPMGRGCPRYEGR